MEKLSLEDKTVERSADRVNQFKLQDKKGALFELKKNPDDAQEVLEFKYVNKKQISPDTFIFTYEVPDNLSLGLGLGQHIAIDAVVPTKECPEGEPICRKYTPTSWFIDEGKFDLLIKVYFKDVHPQFPQGGLMSQYLNDLELFNTIKVRGPFGKLTYLGDGNFKILKKFKPLTYLEKKFNKIGMIAGGTGITPFYQLLQAANKLKDSVEFSLLFGNKSSADILLKEELDEIYREQTFKFNLHYTIDKAEDNWTGSVGYMIKEMVVANTPAPADDVIMLLCGPPVLCKNVITPMLKSLGHKDENIFEF
jgi:cytochrome-b5 reductase